MKHSFALKYLLSTILQGYLTCVINDTMSYSKKSGFTLRLVEDDENDVAGLYVCMAGVNDSYQLAEYSVIRSYENSTFECKKLHYSYTILSCPLFIICRRVQFLRKLQ